MDRPPDEKPPPPPDPAAAPPWPYALAIGLVLALGLVFGAVAREARQEVTDGPDQAAHSWLVAHRHEWPAATAFFCLVTRLGDFPYSVAATALVALAIVGRPAKRTGGRPVGEALFWAAIVATSWGLGRALKAVFRRDRPPADFRLLSEDSFSFPSGHAVFAGAFFVGLAVLVLRTERLRGAAAALLVAAALLAAAIIAASRVWLAVHYVSDVAGGLALGAAWGALAWTVREAWGRRRRSALTPGAPARYRESPSG